MSKKPTNSANPWPVSWQSSREAQFRAMAKSTPAQRLEWLEQALRLASESGALARAETAEKRRRRGLA
jgi:hypothetical protein